MQGYGSPPSPRIGDRDMKFLNKLRRDTRGVAAVEYGMILAFIAMGIVSTVQGIGEQVTDHFSAASDGFPE